MVSLLKCQCVCGLYVHVRVVWDVCSIWWVCVCTQGMHTCIKCVWGLCACVVCMVSACGQLCGVCAWVRCVVRVCGACGVSASGLGDGRDWPSSLAQQFEYRSCSTRSQLSVTQRPCSVLVYPCRDKLPQGQCPLVRPKNSKSPVELPGPGRASHLPC